MTFDANATMHGDKELLKALDQIDKDITGSKMGRAMGKATLVIARAAKQNAPVDTGTLRASITPMVIFGADRVIGSVGSNVKYAPYMELGTRPHTPPWDPIYRWALRVTKGNAKAAGALAARAIISISRKGLAARRYLQQAIEDNADRVLKYLADAVKGIIKEA